MKLEEAIKILSELHDQCCQIDNIFCTDTTGARCEAVDMAIKALEQPELCNDIEEDVEEALRVLDAIRTSGRLNYGDYSNLFDVISGIGIQKSSNDDKGCSNCIYSGRPTYKSPCSECRDNSQWEMKPISRGHENSTECEDTISRQAAIDIERTATVDTNPSHFEAHQKFIQFMDDAEISSFGRWQWSNGFNTALTAIEIDLKKLPSAEPERKTGKWINLQLIPDDITGHTYGECSICGKLRIVDNFCPNCGSFNGGADVNE